MIRNHLKTLVLFFLLLWVVSILYAFFIADSLEKAASLGDSFGGVSAFFSGFALAMTVYSMIQQQKQSADFERVTVSALQNQAEALKALEAALLSQSKVAQIAAATAMIDRLELRISNLKSWGEAKGDENFYRKGIDAAKNKIKDYERKISETSAKL
jgi:hypothetical protein